MSLSLFKENVRSGWKMLVLFCAIMSLYIYVISTMYDPNMASSLAIFAEAMPELMGAFGMTAVTTSLAGFMANYLYGFLLVVFPMIFAVMMANKLVARHVDRGTMAWLLASPNGRGKVVTTQAVTLVLCMLIVVCYVTGLAVAFCQVLFPGELDIGAYLTLNLGLFCALLAISGICFLCSCIFNESKHAVTIGAGIPVFFFLVQMLVNLGDKLENLKYVTILTLFNTDGLLSGTGEALLGAVILAVLGIALYLAGILIFRRRNLPL